MSIIDRIASLFGGPAVSALEPGGAAATGQATSAPQSPSRGPSSDMTYLAHAFEAQAPETLAAWNVDRIRRARDAHALGEFEVSALLADAMLTDARIAAGLLQRLGPPLGIPRVVTGGARWGGKGLTETVRGEAEALFAPESPACPPGTLASGFVSTAMMGPAILQNVWTPRPDGSRVDVETRPWPMQLARWDESRKRYLLQSTDGEVVAEPNDGKWIVIEPYGPRSFLFGALRSLALTWADRAYAMRDRSNHSAAHGSLSIVGTLPEGVQISSEDGAKFKAALQMLQRARAGIIKMFGSTVEAFEPKTLAWQIFGQIVGSANADIMLVLNGINGDSVYKPISQIDGVRYDLVRLELGAATVGYNEGLIVPWTLYNFGDADLTPKLGWLVPDPREQERLDALGRRHQAFAASVSAYAAAGFDVDDPKWLERQAAAFGVEAPPRAPTPPPAPPAPGPEPTPTTPQTDAAVEADAGDAA